MSLVTKHSETDQYSIDNLKRVTLNKQVVFKGLKSIFKSGQLGSVENVEKEYEFRYRKIKTIKRLIILLCQIIIVTVKKSI